MCITILCVPLQYQNKQTMRKNKMIAKTCVRCGNDWSTKCCEYSYKAPLTILDSGKNPLTGSYLTIAQSNSLHKLLNECNK